jgi:hypothetical protein
VIGSPVRLCGCSLPAMLSTESAAFSELDIVLEVELV